MNETIISNIASPATSRMNDVMTSTGVETGILVLVIALVLAFITKNKMNGGWIVFFIYLLVFYGFLRWIGFG